METYKLIAIVDIIYKHYDIEATNIKEALEKVKKLASNDFNTDKIRVALDRNDIENHIQEILEILERGIEL